VKATVPRYRYDQLMRLGWKVFLPLSLLFVVLSAAI
jgi:NADH-quinone oxidoreductase subunit H